MLLVIDCQLAFTSPGSHSRVVDPDRAVSSIAELADIFAGAGLPSAATRHAHSLHPDPGGMGSWWGTFIMEGTPQAELDDRLRPGGFGEVFTKDRYSAFSGTGLSAFLSDHRATALVLCGFQTHICVESTAREAFDLGLDVILVPEACGSVSIKLHEAALLCMGHALAHQVTVDDLRKELGGA